MILDYSIYVTAEGGDWASNTYPDEKKWVVELQGSCSSANRRKALVVGATKALDDLTERCNIRLYLDDDLLVDTISEIAQGLSPQPAAGVGDSALERLLGQMQRHTLVLCYWPEDSRAKALRNRL
jgi:hypothetical protein